MFLDFAVHYLVEDGDELRFLISGWSRGWCWWRRIRGSILGFSGTTAAAAAAV